MYAIMGATGTVGKKIVDTLVKKGEKVRMIARSRDSLRALVRKNAEAFVGDALDTEFLAQAFRGGDAVFTLIPPNPATGAFLSYADQIGSSIARALESAKVPFVVNLSSVGAELPAETGPIVGLHHQEERLNRITGLHVLHMRPGYFMENLLMNIGLISSKNINGSALRGDIKLPMIAAQDIAAFAAERLMKKDFSGSSVRYLLGQRDLSMVAATMTIGMKIGKPNLPYVVFPYAEAEKRLVAAGLSADMSRLYIEMSRAFNGGRIVARRTAENTTPTTLAEFCEKIFVPAYTQTHKAA